MIKVGRHQVSGPDADRISRKLDSVRRLAAALTDQDAEFASLAAQCDAAARNLIAVAALLRLIDKQMKKSGAMGVVHHSK